jgi:aspartyl-tRNA(Asn)/glutamyl-tRNA(Gln) amidotransferase subunit C
LNLGLKPGYTLCVNFDLEGLRHIARLARLELSDAELQSVRARMEAVLEHVDHLKRLDVDGVPPLDHAADLTIARREDEPRPGLTAESALSNAPAVAGPYFTVPRIIEAP